MREDERKMQAKYMLVCGGREHRPLDLARVPLENLLHYRISLSAGQCELIYDSLIPIMINAAQNVGTELSSLAQANSSLSFHAMPTIALLCLPNTGIFLPLFRSNRSKLPLLVPTANLSPLRFHFKISIFFILVSNCDESFFVVASQINKTVAFSQATTSMSPSGDHSSDVQAPGKGIVSKTTPDRSRITKL